MIPRRWIYILPAEYKQILKPSPILMENVELIQRWERDFAEYIKAKYAVALPSGRIGLRLILDFLKIKYGDEIIIPAYTLKALAKIIQDYGAVPICADIDKSTLNISLSSIQSKITKKTKAIIALHTFGNPCEIEEICNLSNKTQIPVIEDCAHACGAKVNNKYVGTFGYASFFSFDISKPINTYGGGMVVTEDINLIDFIKKATAELRADVSEVQKKARALKLEQTLYKTGLMYPILFLRTLKNISRGIELAYRSIQTVPPEDVAYSTLQASLGINKLPLFSFYIEQRLEIVQTYRKLLSDKITIPNISFNVTPSYYMFVVVLPKKARHICRSLLLRGIDCSFENEIIDNLANILGDNNCKVAQEVYPYLLGLPLYNSLKTHDIEYICNTLNKLL